MFEKNNYTFVTFAVLGIYLCAVICEPLVFVRFFDNVYKYFECELY